MDDTPEALAHRPAVVIRLSNNMSKDAIKWLVQRISGDKLGNDCQLDVVQSENLLYVSASSERLMLGAEVLGLKKKYKDGTWRDFTRADGVNFKNFLDDDFLLVSECFLILKHELDGLRATSDEFVPGHPLIQLYSGRRIIPRLQEKNLITDYFPLHSSRELEYVKSVWLRNGLLSMKKPINEIYKYFGHSIGIYFAFLHFYLIGLIPLVIWAVIVVIHGKSRDVIEDIMMALLVSFWSTILLEMWKRSSSEYLYTWGFSGTKDWQEPRPSFYGEIGTNPVSRKKEPMYPAWKRYLRICCISFPIIVLSIGLSISLMLYYFSWEIYFMQIYVNDDLLSLMLKNIPCIIYSILVIVADLLYRRLARFLTTQENHRLEYEFQNHLIFKNLMFVFTNNFLCLYYVAFVYDDLEVLRKTLRNLFLVHIFISQSVESLIPYWRFTKRSAKLRNELSSSKGYRFTVFESTTKIHRDAQTNLELSRDQYVVCEQHFKPEDICKTATAYDEKTGQTLSYDLTVPQLVPGAVPTLLPNCPFYLSSSATSSRASRNSRNMLRERKQLATA